MSATDFVETYAIKIDGKKCYKCSLCNYDTNRLSNIKTHIMSKNHLAKFEAKPAESLPITIVKPVERDNSFSESPKNTPDKPRMKGKTYLSQYCKESIKLDMKGTNWGRSFDITLDDIKHFIQMQPSNYIEYFLIKLIRKITVDKFPFRCLDRNRNKFYYNDINDGWIEDLGNREIIKMIMAFLGNSILEAHKFYTTTDELNDLINYESLTYVKMNYCFWGCERVSMQEPSQNKTEGGAKKEINNTLQFLGEILDCE